MLSDRSSVLDLAVIVVCIALLTVVDVAQMQ